MFCLTALRSDFVAKSESPTNPAQVTVVEQEKTKLEERRLCRAWRHTHRNRGKGFRLSRDDVHKRHGQQAPLVLPHAHVDVVLKGFSFRIFAISINLQLTIPLNYTQKQNTICGT